MYDTPGTDSEENTLECALLLRASLIGLPINLIMINAKFDSRFNKTLK